MNPIAVVMISCAKRQAQRDDTLGAFENLGFGTPLVVLDSTVCEGRGLVVDRPQERQERASIEAIKQGLATPAEYILFLEDDLRFNNHLQHNLRNWGPLKDGCMDLGSLYNPTVVGPSNDTQIYSNTRFADPEKVYGSQAFIISRRLARYCVDEWWSVEGMQDIKISRLAAAMPGAYPICYHSPSLVQHVGHNSAWTQDNRFHQAPDFSKDWRA